MKGVEHFLSLILLVASSDAILNGDLSPHKPYYARITFWQGTQTNVQNRSGTILSDRFVLTTASFFLEANEITVWVGSYVRTQQQNHPATTSLRLSTFPDGPALLQLNTPLVFNRFVQSIRIVPNDWMGMPNEQGMVVGMGGFVPGISHDRLNAAYLRILPTQNCTSAYPTRNSTAYFCAYDQRERSDFCPDDQGSAFTIVHRGEEFLFGVAVESLCTIADHSTPSLFASIIYFRNLINEILDGRARA